MKTRTHAAQVTKPKVELDRKTCVETVCSLVQVGVCELCYARELFDSDCFEAPVTVDGLEGLKPNMLRVGKGAPTAANDLMGWIFTSLPDAVQRGYAKRFIFGIAQDHRGTKLLEEYVFKFEYDMNGGIRCSLPSKRGGKPNVETARTQVVRLMRSIVSVAKTLDAVPAERWLFAKMEYTESCPADYQPEYFEAAGDRAVGYFHTKPFSMRFGDVTTPFNSVDVGCRSVLDHVEVLPGRGPTADNVSRFETTRGGWTGNDAAAEDTDAEDGGGDNSAQLQHMHVDTAELFSQPFDGSGRGLPTRTPAASGFVPDSDLLRHARELEAWASGRATVSALGALQRFVEVPVATVEAALAMLVARGALLRTSDPGSFKVAARSAAPASAAGLSEVEVAERLGGLRMAAGKGKPPPPAELQSKAGGIHSVPGSARTQSVDGGATVPESKRVRRISEVDANARVWPSTQGSDLAEDVEEERRRKVSIVQRPIHQKAAVAAVESVAAASPSVRKMHLRAKANKGSGRMKAMRG